MTSFQIGLRVPSLVQSLGQSMQQASPTNKKNPQVQKAKTPPSAPDHPYSMYPHTHTSHSNQHDCGFQGHWEPFLATQLFTFLHHNISSTLQICTYQCWSHAVMRAIKGHNMRSWLVFCTKLWHSNVKSGPSYFDWNHS